MLIHINLHPDGGKRRRRGLPVSAVALGRIAAPFRDRYLVGAVAAVIVSCGAVAGLHLSQQHEGAALEAQVEVAQRDSARFSSVIKARSKAVSRRDSLARELLVISAIDSTRYTWAHLLDEVSASLPPYTWLSSVTQTSAPPAPPAVVAKGDKPAEKPKPGTPAVPAVDSALVRFRVVGLTVDIQALTQFMRDLEESPFVRNVQLAHSEPSHAQTPGNGRELTEFTIDAELETAPRELLRTVTLTVPVR